jgi:spore coat polysaccharide biosynthesis protein SpsF
VAWAVQEGVAVVRGETDDVLSRYIKCVKTFPSDFVIRVTADNPLTDPWIIGLVIDEMKKGHWDYVNAVKGYPIGSGIDAFKSTLIHKLNKEVKNSTDREHINRYVLDNMNKFSCYYLTPPEEFAREDVRITIDTVEDWQKMIRLLDNLTDPLEISIKDAIERFDRLSI